MLNYPCPNCGYCPICGRPKPNPITPYYPWHPYPTSPIIWCGTASVTIIDPKPENPSAGT